MRWQALFTLCASTCVGAPEAICLADDRASSTFDQERAAAGGQTLAFNDVLDAVYMTHPSLEKSGLYVQEAEGEQFAAQGAWDPSLSVDGKWTPGGYYKHGEVDAKVKQATPLYGASLYAGYRLGQGKYPIYKGDLETLDVGELRAGLSVPLLKDGPIDARRARIERSDVLLEAARCDVVKTRLILAQKAAQNYLRWVASGLEMRIQRELLEVAETRNERLHAQVALGSLPSIVTVDNERLVLDRRAKLVESERDFQHASLALSLYLRDEEKRPIRVAEERLPEVFPVLVDTTFGDEEGAVDRALRVRPEVCVMSHVRSAADVDVRLTGNQRAPSLHAQAFVSRDLGDGPKSLGPTAYGLGVHFEMPLLLRDARGKHASAQAKARAIDTEMRGLKDAIAVEVRAARVSVEAAAKQLNLARRQAELARTLAQAEREKFEQGSSDLVIVNLRELAAADAARMVVEAHAAHEKAAVDYLASIGQTPE